MNSQEIKLIIGGRVYPVNTTSKQETALKEAVNRINEQLLIIEAKHSIKDKQDSLAILALQLMVARDRMVPSGDSKTVDKKPENNQEISDAVDALISKIDFHLKVD